MTSGHTPPAHWEVLESRELLDASPWVNVSVQRVRLPDGRVIDDYHQVRMPEFVVMYPRTLAGRVILLRQYRHGVGEVCLALPGGGIEEGEPPVEAARRELLEETGYAAPDWRPLGQFVVNGNQGCGRAHFFVADGAAPVAEPDSGDLEGGELVLATPDELAAALSSGEIKTVTSAALVALAAGPAFGGTSAEHGG